MDRMLESFIPKILTQLGADNVFGVEKIQSLWSDYGAIFRIRLNGSYHQTVVVKCIVFEEKSDHPRGWATNRSHKRKLKSYLIENCWYENYVAALPASVNVPQLLYSEHTSRAQVLVLEDLSIDYPELKQRCTYREAQSVVKWLAQFHALFVNATAEGLWPTGTYWHLDTRPEEWQAMEASTLKEKARAIDDTLNNARFQTIVHGDAKVANFCFGQQGQVAAVDFQYVGKGVGVKDLAYFIGSCFTNEECQLYEHALLDDYFEHFGGAIKGMIDSERTALEKEWRALYPVAWADFNRFLLGWLPSHQKLHGHALSKNEEAFKFLEA